MVIEVSNLRKSNMFKELLAYINIKNPLFRFFLWISFFGLVALADLLIPTTNLTDRSAYIFKFITTFVTSGVVFYMVRYGFGVKAANPLNFLVSTWIVFLLIHPTNDIWTFIVAVAAIAVGKFLFRRNRQPIFNPAALALVITYLISVLVTLINPTAETLFVTWWGTDMFQNITTGNDILYWGVAIFFLGSFLYTTTLFKKTTYALSFLITNIIASFIYFLLTGPMETALPAGGRFASYALFNATAFAALVMIPEPKTSPIFQKHQIVVGAIGGLILVAFNLIIPSIPIDPLINTILVTNIIVLIVKMQKTKAKAPAPVPKSVPNTPSQLDGAKSGVGQPPPQQPINQNTQNIA